MAVWKFKRLFYYFVCVFFKDQVAGEWGIEEQDRIHPGLQPGSEPSLSRQRRQKKREQTEHSGEKRQVGRDLLTKSLCYCLGNIF